LSGACGGVSITFASSTVRKAPSAMNGVTSTVPPKECPWWSAAMSRESMPRK
jgi:hypothetical protein